MNIFIPIKPITAFAFLKLASIIYNIQLVHFFVIPFSVFYFLNLASFFLIRSRYIIFTSNHFPIILMLMAFKLEKFLITSITLHFNYALYFKNHFPSFPTFS